MNKGSTKVLAVLDRKLARLAQEKHELGLVRDEASFSRKPRKLDFEDDMKLIMSMGPSSLKEEMHGYFGLNADAASAAGFVKSRAKIREEAFRKLMEMMNRAYPCDRTYKGCRLLAVDGSDITIPADKDDFLNYSFNNANHSAGYSTIHLNALHGILNHRYLDASIQNMREENERQAMVDLAKGYRGGKAIFIADRGYEAYNIFENVRNTGNFFLIRVRNAESAHSICRRFKALPSSNEFDEEVDVTFTNRQTNEIKAHPERYMPIMANQRFDFLDRDRRFHDARYRFVRIRIDGKDERYETLVTNLPKEGFSSSDIKGLYKLRWGIEVSYRHLKYSANLNALHSRRRDFIKQEIWARLVMFNVSMIIIDEAASRKLEKKGRKHEYQINVSHAMHLVRDSISKRKGGVPPDLIELIAKDVLPIRPGRKSKRNVRYHPFASFNYRFC